MFIQQVSSSFMVSVAHHTDSEFSKPGEVIIDCSKIAYQPSHEQYELLLVLGWRYQIR